MRRKKLVFGLLGLVIIAVVYYFNTSYVETTKKLEQTKKLKQQINLQLNELRIQGFSISNREIKKEEEHFFITLDDPKKAVVFFSQKGIRVKLEETEELRGLTLGADVAYLNDTIALELYPVELPINLTTLLTKENNKELLAQVDVMIKKKIFFVHIDLDHSATTFKGYFKDINETIRGGEEVKFSLHGYHFSGNVKEERIVKFKQTLNTCHLYMRGEIDRTISGLKSNYALTGATAYDYTSSYTIEKLKIDDPPQTTLLANDISLFSTSSVKDGLAVERLKTKIKNIDLISEKEKVGMQTLEIEMNMSNIDINTYKKLQKVDAKDEKKVDALLETLVSKNIHLEIPMLSVDRVTLHEKEMLGFSLDAKLDVDKSLDIYRLDIDPKHVLNKIDGDINLSLSKEILTLLKEDPKAMLIYMIYRPKRALGQKIYDINIKDSSVKINDKVLEF